MKSEDIATQTARLFTNGRSQAVRIPKHLAFDGVSEVVIRKEGRKLILEPLRKTWTSFIDSSSPGAELVDEDFMEQRPDLLKKDRVTF